MDEATGTAAEVEQWFVHQGLPHLIADYSATDDIFTRAAPFLGVVMFFELFTTFGDDWTGWWQVFAFLAGVGIVVGIFGLVNKMRRRSFFQLPNTIGPIELSLFVLLPPLLPLILKPNATTSIVVVIITNLVVLGLVYLISSYALFSMVVWAIRQMRHQLGRLSDLVAKSLPLLLLFSAFLFVNAELWQVAHDFSGLFFALTCGLLLIVGIAFVLFSLRRAADEVGAFVDWQEVEGLCCDSPVAHVAVGELEGTPDDANLTDAARRNVRLVLAVSLGIQIALVAVVIGLFYVLFGLLAVREATIVQWVSDDTLMDADVVGRLNLFGGGEVVLTRQLLYVSGFIAAFSGLQFTVSILTDQSYRQEFAEELMGEVREALAVRAVYMRTLITRT